MIDWVSIVRHSRRRFSNYVYGVPHKVRKKRLSKKTVPGQNEHLNLNIPKCTCCWSEGMQSRYAEEEMPPPPSPPTLREITKIDGLSRQSSLERAINRRASVDREPTPIRENHKLVYLENQRMQLNSRNNILQKLAGSSWGADTRTSYGSSGLVNTVVLFGSIMFIKLMHILTFL